MRLLIVVAVLLSFGGNVFALDSWEKKLYARASRDDQQAYQTAVYLCTGYLTARPWEARFYSPLTYFSESIKDSLFLGATLKVALALDHLLDNEWFHRGMGECYGENLVDRLVFVGALISADLAGKAVGTIAWSAGLGELRVALNALEGVSLFASRLAKLGIYGGVTITLTVRGIKKVLADDKVRRKIRSNPSAIADEIQSDVIVQLDRKIAAYRLAMATADSDPARNKEFSEKIETLAKLKEKILILNGQ